MAIGDILHNERAETADPYTGRPVIRLTTPTRTSHHMYFYNRMVTGDSRKLLDAWEQHVRPAAFA